MFGAGAGGRDRWGGGVGKSGSKKKGGSYDQTCPDGVEKKRGGRKKPKNKNDEENMKKEGGRGAEGENGGGEQPRTPEGGGKLWASLAHDNLPPPKSPFSKPIPPLC